MTLGVLFVFEPFMRIVNLEARSEFEPRPLLALSRRSDLVRSGVDSGRCTRPRERHPQQTTGVGLLCEASSDAAIVPGGADLNHVFEGEISLGWNRCEFRCHQIKPSFCPTDWLAKKPTLSKTGG